MTARDGAVGSPTGATALSEGQTLATRFQVWGCRGSRNAIGSRIGNATSCYSLAVGEDLFVFDAGSGLLPLSAALTTDPRLEAITRVHVLISHSHWDHWEGLKDAEWMWRKENGLALNIFAPAEALEAIRSVSQPPSFVPLDILALGTLRSLNIAELAAGTPLDLPGATVHPMSLHHYSGVAPDCRYLDTLGYRLEVHGGPTVAYLCDHEPTEATADMEKAALASADLAIVDASYGDVSEHAFGHASIEWVAQLAERNPSACVLAAHHGAMRTDEQIEDAARRYGAGLDGFAIAIEGSCRQWDPEQRRFVELAR